MQITEFREFDPCLFSAVHGVLRDSPLKPPTLSADVVDILQALAYPTGRPLVEKRNQFDDSLNLLRAAAKLRRFFVIRPPEAPGLCFCGRRIAEWFCKRQCRRDGFVVCRCVQALHWRSG